MSGQPGPVTIRDLASDAGPALLPLLAELGYPADAVAATERLRALFAADPSARIIGAYDANGSLLGFAALHETPVPHRPTPVARITALAVLNSAQGSGAGRALVEAAEAHFRGRGLTRLEVTSGPTHAAAHDFYRHLGYADQGVRFAKELKK